MDDTSQAPRHHWRFDKRHHDDEYIDAITIQTVPRYKTSGLSGDEWRTSAWVRFYRKGHLVYERVTRNIETAVQLLGYDLLIPRENGEWIEVPDHTQCFQPGCGETAVSEYRLKHEYSRVDGMVKPSYGFDVRRRFCQQHLQRGDCGLEDSDSNYEVLSGAGPEQAKPAEGDIRPSMGPFLLGSVNEEAPAEDRHP